MEDNTELSPENILVEETIEERLSEDFQQLLERLASAAIYYCAKGFDTFDEVLLTSNKIEKNQIQELLEGSIHTYARVLGHMQDQMTAFQRDALDSILAIPTPPLTEADTYGSEHANESQEQLCDAELADLVSQIVEVKAATRKAQLETTFLKQECDYFGNTEQLASVIAPIASGKENLSQNVEAILSQAQKLGPLLEHAEKVLVHHHDTKAALTFQTATSLAEKEFVARKAASKGLLADDLRRLREGLSID